MRLALLTSLLLALAAPARADKAGPVMLNLKVGPSVEIYIEDTRSDPLDAPPAFFALQVEGGIALDKRRSAYLVLPFEIHVGTRSAGPFGASFAATLTKIIVPLGFQYDIPIPSVPGLYLYPRASLGYVAYIASSRSNMPGGSFSGTDTRHGGIFAFEAGIKYVFRRRATFGFEPLSIPVHFFRPIDNTLVFVDYRLHFYAGVNF